MRTLKLCVVLGLFMATAGVAQALPSNRVGLTPYQDLRFSVNMSGFEIDYSSAGLLDNTGALVTTNAALAYVPAAIDSAAVGYASGGRYVLYDHTGEILADVDATGAFVSGVDLSVVLANSTFTAFGVGVVDNVQNPDGTVHSLPQTYPGGPGTHQQMTFTVANLPLTFVPVVNPGTGTFDTGFDVTTGLATGTTLTTFLPGGVLEIVEDGTTDAQGAPSKVPAPGDGSTLPGELPVSYFDPLGTGTADYYELVANGGSPDFAFNSPVAPAPEFDAAEDTSLVLVHIGGLTGTDSFQADLGGPASPGIVGGGYVAPELAALSDTFSGYAPTAYWTGGRTTFQDKQTSLAIVGGSWASSVLDPSVGFRMTSDVAFGFYQTGSTPTTVGPPGAGQTDPGALPASGATFTFQTPEGGGPEIFGGEVIPEPLTVLGVFLGVGGLAGYIRRRRTS